MDATMENVHETINDMHEMEEALREGFRTLPSASDSLNDEDLENELNDLLNANGDNIEVKSPSSLSDANEIDSSNFQVRIGKRVLDLSDLPDVPKNTPISTSSKSSLDLLETRWKRLRAE